MPIKERSGIVVSNKMEKTIVVSIENRITHKKYGKLIAKTKKQYGCTFDFYFCDGTTLKTIERANPSLVVLHKGTIMQKLHYNDSEQLIFN